MLLVKSFFAFVISASLTPAFLAAIAILFKIYVSALFLLEAEAPTSLQIVSTRDESPGCFSRTLS